MPKGEIDYNSTIIYKLVCKDLNVKHIYVGHTTNFVKRKQSHKNRCNNANDKKYNLKVYQIIRENNGWDNWSMIEIEKYQCKDSNEARSRERYWYELLNAKLNSYCPTKDLQKVKAKQKRSYENNKEKRLETVHEYAKTHKDEIKESSKAYRENNAELIKAFKGKVCVCAVCNREYTHAHKARHERTQVHLKALNKKP